MITAPDLPAFAAILVALLLLLGAAITLVGAIGLLRLPDFYQRVHAPTLGMTLGTFCIALASMLCFSLLQRQWVLHEILISAFLLLTAPATLMILVQSGAVDDGMLDRPGPGEGAASDGEEQ